MENFSNYESFLKKIFDETIYEIKYQKYMQFLDENEKKGLIDAIDYHLSLFREKNPDLCEILDDYFFKQIEQKEDLTKDAIIARRKGIKALEFIDMKLKAIEIFKSDYHSSLTKKVDEIFSHYNKNFNGEHKVKKKQKVILGPINKRYLKNLKKDLEKEFS